MSSGAYRQKRLIWTMPTGKIRAQSSAAVLVFDPGRQRSEQGRPHTVSSSPRLMMFVTGRSAAGLPCYSLKSTSR
ncbi:unnamed protein product, partial [Prorocentrum cordatum]